MTNIEQTTEPAGREPEVMEADLFLLHAPSVYDFRERDDLLFAYLSDSDSVNVTTIYEMYPLGFFSIKQRLMELGYKVEIVNLASLMLMYPDISVEALLARLRAPVFGLDLHWMAHCHGSIEVAKLLRRVHPDAKTLFGGISATYYAEQLIRIPAVDFVLQGYDTLEPVAMLMRALTTGAGRLDEIPNLLHKSPTGEVASNGFTHKPARDYNAATTDWSYYGKPGKSVLTTPLIMTLPNTGCAMNCGWCGGSRYAYRNIMGVKKTLIQKEHRRVVDELRSLGEAARRSTIYALQCYSESKARLHEYFDAVKEMGYRSVAVEQFHLTDEDTLEKMGESTKASIMLSPESHDPVISRLAGRGTYTMEEMEAWIPRALDRNVSVMVWFFIGMPRQDKQSVHDTIDYCERLMRKFRGKEVIPLVCPMVPFLDPGSQFFEEPEKHGYRIIHRTLDEHRQAMVAPLWFERLNYETEWMSRRELQDVTYEAIGRLIRIKGDLGVLPGFVCEKMLETIEVTKDILAEMERALTLDRRLPADLRDTIRSYNRKILSYSSDQIIPLRRPFGGRWFDDFSVPASIIERCRRAPCSA